MAIIATRNGGKNAAETQCVKTAANADQAELTALIAEFKEGEPVNVPAKFLEHLKRHELVADDAIPGVNQQRLEKETKGPDKDKRLSKRQIFLGMPGYGKVTGDAARAFFRNPVKDLESLVAQEYQQGSLLAANFNALWCRALNIVHRGGKVDYFAMLHDDVAPEPFWLDKAIDELEANHLDVLGVVVPIKDPRGMTSIALDNDIGDPWQPLCRLTMQEVYRLPKTFTSADVGHRLLLNTGCWVCKFDIAWARLVRFAIQDTITFCPKDNSYKAVTESEDWYFSRLLHEIGRGPSADMRPLRIGATRAVRLIHHGEVLVPNMKPWGSEAYDSQSHFITESIIKAKRNPDLFPYDVEGWLTESEGAKLRELAKGKHVLEIGSFCGKSTICLAATAQSVVAVDPHDARGTLPTPRYTFNEFKANLAKYGVAGHVRPVVGTIEDISGQFDLIFIDGNHAREAVANDIAHALELLAPAGLLVFHDYRNSVDPGVAEAVDALLGAGGQLVSLTDTLAVVQPAETTLEV